MPTVSRQPVSRSPVVRPSASPRLAGSSPLEAAAARWAQRKLGRLGHERRVLAIADKLFDLLAARLGLGDSDRLLLRLAALTHDVGRHASEKDHPRLGAEMLDRTAALDLSPARRRRLAYLARYHRGAVPPAGREEYLTPADPRPALRATLALLRAADTLDSRHLPHPRLVLSVVAGRLHVRCVVAGQLAESRRVFGRHKKYRLLESLLGQAVSVTVVAE